MREILDSIHLRPKYCVWEITRTCNMRCLHCASNLSNGRSRQDELTLEEALSLCNDLHTLGCEKVVLSGGEALLRKDWDEIARKLVSLGIYVSLISNGFIIDRLTAERIKGAGLCRVALSLDGEESTHNFIRGNGESFQRVLKAASYLREQQIPVNIVTHINRTNLPELGRMECLIVSLGVDVWRLQLGSPMGRMANHPELVVEPGQLPAIADFVVAAKRRNIVKISVGDNIGYFSSYETKLRDTPNRGDWNFWCGCSAGCLNVGIESNGNVKGCLSLQAEEFVEGNIRRESLREIWERKGSFSYTRGFKPEDLLGYCRECGYGEICRGGCTFMAFGSTGSVHNNPYCLYAVMKKGKAFPTAPRP
jgi:radical SAM protein with 4Fe4S-binding SPASM domain